MLTAIQQKKIWVIGSIERLSWFGYFMQVPIKLAEEFVETYWRIDDDRHKIIDNSLEIFNLILEIFPELCSEEATEVYEILAAFKNSRTKVFVWGMQKICLT